MHGWDLDCVRATARARSAGTRSRSTATTSRRSTAPSPRRESIRDRPTMIVARTMKGKGVTAVEDKPGWHGKALDNPEEAVAELGGERNLRVEVHAARAGASRTASRRPGRSSCRATSVGAEVATRKAYGDALAALGTARGDVVALDGEVRNSTYAEDFAQGAARALLRDVHRRAADGRRGGRACRCAAGGRSRRPSPPSSRARTTSSAWRRSRRATYSLCGSHAGVSIGEDGPSQMALEDLAVMRAVHGIDGALPVRREPDGEARRGDGRPRGHLVPAHDAREDAGHLRPGRGVPDRRLHASSARRRTTRSRSSAPASRCTRR